MSNIGIKEFITQLDRKEIAYALLATVLTAIFAVWRGGFRAIWLRIKLYKSLSSYKKSLQEDCLYLTVIGRREGFSLNSTYIPLDLALSDLGAKNRAETLFESPSRVIVAGP